MTKSRRLTSTVYGLTLLLVCPAGIALANETRLTPEARNGITLFAPPPTVSQPASCLDGAWDVLGTFAGFVARDVAVNPAGDVFVVGDSTAPDSSSRLAILRSPASTQSWELVDEFVYPGGSSASGHRIHVAADGRVYALGLSVIGGDPYVVIRKSAENGDPGSWSSANRLWQRASLGAITSDAAGRVYVALGFTTASNTLGWDVESALHASGSWTLHDHFVLSPGAVTGAVPQDIELRSSNELLVTGQLNGSPDLWITRHGTLGPRGTWKTVDLYALAPGSYGLAGTSVIALPAPEGQSAKVVVAGFGAEGSGQEDYLWITRASDLDFSESDPEWEASFYQLEPGQHSFALDAEVDTQGRLLVLGVAGTSSDTELLLRRSWDDGVSWENLVSYSGITLPFDARLAVSEGGNYVAVANRDNGAVVLSCQGL